MARLSASSRWQRCPPRASLARVPALLLLALLVGLAVACSDAGPAAVGDTDTSEPRRLPGDLTDEPVAWLLEHGHPLASLASDDFSDLQFLRSVLDGARLVQLGESGHGVAEFTEAKVRLIRFLHEEMGFDVLAFESSLYECFQADRRAATATPRETMRSCLYSVWHVAEILPLFDYLRETWATDRPLRLAGFDMKWSSSSGILDRPEFLGDVVGRVDSRLGREVREVDRELLTVQLTGGTDAVHLRSFYLSLLDFLDAHRVELAEAFAGDPQVPLVARQVVESLLSDLQFMESGSDGEVRDRGMAANLSWLAGTQYPDRKIIAWGHNGHIRYANRAAWTGTFQEKRYSAYTMGETVKERFFQQGEVYTLGLYMYQGEATLNTRVPYTIFPADPATLEGYLARAEKPFLLVDFKNPGPQGPPSWFSAEVRTREWGQWDLTLVPQDQYDGVLLIRTVRPPAYLY